MADHEGVPSSVARANEMAMRTKDDVEANGVESKVKSAALEPKAVYMYVQQQPMV